jgi:hypothetical protein
MTKGNTHGGTRRRWRVYVSATALATLLSVGLLSAPAVAAQGPLQLGSGGSGTTAAGSTTRIKVKPVYARHGGVTPNSACGNNCYLFPDSSYTITPPGGRSGAIESYGQTNYIPYWYPFPGDNIIKMDFYNTKSTSGWWGSTPYYCNSVSDEDVWGISYFAVSWGWGGGPNGSFTFGDGQAAYQSTVYGNYFDVNHSVQHIYLTVSGGSIYSVEYDVHGNYQFGSNFYETDAYSGASVP